MASFYRGAGRRATAERAFPSAQGRNFIRHPSVADNTFENKYLRSDIASS
jgi:hypothetical protein